ncbi:DsbA family protein [Humidesulfovibrio sp.]
MRRTAFRNILAVLAALSLLAGLGVGSALAAKAATEKTAPGKAASEKAAPQGFAVEAFRKNFIAGLASRPNAPALDPADVQVDTAEKAASFAGTEIFVVRGALAPKGGQAQPFTLFVSADGRFYVSDIIELAAGKSVLKPARDKMRALDLKSLGHTLVTGTGARTVIYVSDPFCPYCRTGFAYMMGKTAAFGEFKLAHLPLSSHPGADIACALMAWAADKAPERSLDFARFAYADLAAPSVQDRSPANLKQAWVEVAAAFLKRFPELKALGDSGEAIVEALVGSSWEASVREDMAKAAALDISGTPVSFVDGVRVEGFDHARLESLLK